MAAYEPYYGGAGSSSFYSGAFTLGPVPLNRSTGLPKVNLSIPNFQTTQSPGGLGGSGGLTTAIAGSSTTALVSGGLTDVGGPDTGPNASEPLYGTGSPSAVLGDIFRRNFQEPRSSPGVSYVPVQQGSQVSGMAMLLLLGGIAAAVYFFYVRKNG